MSWETVIVAIIAAGSSAAIALIPMFLKRRDDRLKEARDKLKTEIDSARQATDELIRNLSARVAELAQERDEADVAKEKAEVRLDEERAKRREAESKAAGLEIINHNLRNRVERLEKGQTGPLKPK